MRFKILAIISLLVAGFFLGLTPAEAQMPSATSQAPQVEKEVGACNHLPPRQLRLFKALPAEDPCANRGTSLVAATDSQTLFLCREGKSTANYDLALGWGGVDKTAEGDLKTPTGTYALGKPRASDKFGIFIPVGYPTAEQKSQGFTGRDVGVHGPKRFFRCAGFMNVTFNWTQGCMAVADDSFIKEIAQFVKTSGAREIHIVK